MTSRIDIINFLIKKYNFKRYLEIGVRNPADCFNQIDCFDDQIDSGNNAVNY